MPDSWLEDEEETISINYTSGTTGQPKGVQYTYRGAYLNALSEVIVAGMSPESVYLWTLPMFHCNGWCFPWAVTAVAAHARGAARGRSRSRLAADRRGGRDALQRRANGSADDHQPSQGAPPGAAGDRDGCRIATVADAAGSHGRAQLPNRARLRPDRDLRPDHGVSNSGGMAASCRSSSGQSCSRARARPIPRPTWSGSSTRTCRTSRRTPRRWARWSCAATT